MPWLRASGPLIRPCGHRDFGGRGRSVFFRQLRDPANIVYRHNEEGRIAATVREIHQALWQAAIAHEILVSNDSSRDRTGDVLKELRRQIPELRYVNNEPPNGFGYAVRCGLSTFRGDAVAIVMADSSDSPADLVTFHRKLQEGYECVFGSRFMRGAQVVGYPWPKLMMNRVPNFFIRVLFWRISRSTSRVRTTGSDRGYVKTGCTPRHAYTESLTFEHRDVAGLSPLRRGESRETSAQLTGTTPRSMNVRRPDRFSRPRRTHPAPECRR